MYIKKRWWWENSKGHPTIKRILGFLNSSKMDLGGEIMPRKRVCNLEGKNWSIIKF